MVDKDFKHLYERVNAVFNLIMQESEAGGDSCGYCDHISRTIIHKWQRSDPICLGSWAREKLRKIPPTCPKCGREMGYVEGGWHCFTPYWICGISSESQEERKKYEIKDRKEYEVYLRSLESKEVKS